MLVFGSQQRVESLAAFARIMTHTLPITLNQGILSTQSIDEELIRNSKHGGY
ncbi:hypothetical protein [Psychrobacter pygoscelis]|uniref:hypothetical protein n=1 Tax=Psychrobacter pygoscelis TaxID=2488563 RepID=UPI0013F3BB25|nr:hypothetical protein [Psychrobacter pygoscelis]